MAMEFEVKHFKGSNHKGQSKIPRLVKLTDLHKNQAIQKPTEINFTTKIPKICPTVARTVSRNEKDYEKLPISLSSRSIENALKKEKFFSSEKAKVDNLKESKDKIRASSSSPFLRAELATEDLLPHKGLKFNKSPPVTKTKPFNFTYIRPRMRRSKTDSEIKTDLARLEATKQPSNRPSLKANFLACPLTENKFTNTRNKENKSHLLGLTTKDSFPHNGLKFNKSPPVTKPQPFNFTPARTRLRRSKTDSEIKTDLAQLKATTKKPCHRPSLRANILEHPSAEKKCIKTRNKENKSPLLGLATKDLFPHKGLKFNKSPPITKTQPFNFTSGRTRLRRSKTDSEIKTDLKQQKATRQSANRRSLRAKFPEHPLTDEKFAFAAKTRNKENESPLLGLKNKVGGHSGLTFKIKRFSVPDVFFQEPDNEISRPDQAGNLTQVKTSVIKSGKLRNQPTSTVLK